MLLVITVGLSRSAARAFLDADDQFAGFVDLLAVFGADQDHLTRQLLRLGVDALRIPTLLLLLGAVHETLAADGHVGLGAADELNIVIINRPQCEACLVEAELADGVQLLDLLGLGHQVED